MKNKIICTIGPASENVKTLRHFKKCGVDLYRINLSHTKFVDLKKKIIFLKKNIGINKICIDTEGAQIRTSYVKKPRLLKIDEKFLFGFDKNADFKLYPTFSISNLKIGSKVQVGFDDLDLKITKKLKDKIECKVISSGLIGSNKGVHFENNIKLNTLTEKDYKCIDLASKLGVTNFALSFANKPSDINVIRKIIKKKSVLISKIETKNALKNLKPIVKHSDAVLIDRGDLSRYIPVFRIPIKQLNILKISKKLKTPVYIATNLLETMVTKPTPTRAESNDVFQSLYHGASGLVLAAETAIGKYPEKCVSFLKESISQYSNYLKSK